MSRSWLIRHKEIPNRARQTLQDVGELVGDPVDTRRTITQFLGAFKALADMVSFLLMISFDVIQIRMFICLDMRTLFY
jgi:hypothetical protein